MTHPFIINRVDVYHEVAIKVNDGVLFLTPSKASLASTTSTSAAGLIPTYAYSNLSSPSRDP